VTAAPRDLAEIRRIVHDTIEEILPMMRGEAIDEALSLRQIGADSVDRVEIITGLVHRLQLTVPISAFSDVPDIGALIALLHRQARDAA
jgi:polyketide biosynthesis acyl carrier protein